MLQIALVPAVRVEALSSASSGARQGEGRPDLPEAQWNQFVKTWLHSKIQYQLKE